MSTSYLLNYFGDKHVNKFDSKFILLICDLSHKRYKKAVLYDKSIMHPLQTKQLTCVCTERGHNSGQNN